MNNAPHNTRRTTQYSEPSKDMLLAFLHSYLCSNGCTQTAQALVRESNPQYTGDIPDSFLQDWWSMLWTLCRSSTATSSSNRSSGPAGFNSNAPQHLAMDNLTPSQAAYMFNQHAPSSDDAVFKVPTRGGQSQQKFTQGMPVAPIQQTGNAPANRRAQHKGAPPQQMAQNQSPTLYPGPVPLGPQRPISDLGSRTPQPYGHESINAQPQTQPWNNVEARQNHLPQHAGKNTQVSTPAMTQSQHHVQRQGAAPLAQQVMPPNIQQRQHQQFPINGADNASITNYAESRFAGDSMFNQAMFPSNVGPHVNGHFVAGDINDKHRKSPGNKQARGNMIGEGQPHPVHAGPHELMSNPSNGGVFNLTNSGPLRPEDEIALGNSKSAFNQDTRYQKEGMNDGAMAEKNLMSMSFGVGISPVLSGIDNDVSFTDEFDNDNLIAFGRDGADVKGVDFFAEPAAMSY